MLKSVLTEYLALLRWAFSLALGVDPEKLLWGTGATIESVAALVRGSLREGEIITKIFTSGKVGTYVFISNERIIHVFSSLTGAFKITQNREDIEIGDIQSTRATLYRFDPSLLILGSAKQVKIIGRASMIRIIRDYICQITLKPDGGGKDGRPRHLAIEKDLKRLGDLRDKGVLTTAEFGRLSATFTRHQKG